MPCAVHLLSLLDMCAQSCAACYSVTQYILSLCLFFKNKFHTTETPHTHHINTTYTPDTPYETVLSSFSNFGP